MIRAAIPSWPALGALSCLALVAGCGPSDGTRAPSAPFDVVLLVVDTLRADQLGAYGNPENIAPNLDRFASEAIVYTNAYAQASWTKTSVASLFTGLYPAKHQVYDEEQRPRGFLPERFHTLAELFRDAGYFTAAVSGNPHITAANGFDQGFDRFDVPNREWAGSNSGEITELTLSALEEIHDRAGRFFLYVHYLDPHDPWINDDRCAQIMRDARAEDSHARRGIGFVLSGESEIIKQGLQKTTSPTPRPLSESDRDYVRKLYACEIHRVDANIGRILDRMQTLGLLRNAIVIITADHGEEFWEHGKLSHGYQLHDETIHVPLMVRDPHLGIGHTQEPEPVALIDLYRTLAETLAAVNGGTGGALPIDGVVLPRFWNPRPRDGTRTIYGETRFRNQRQAYAIEGRRKLIVDTHSGQERLFDLAQDPGEASPSSVAASEHGARLKEMLAHYLSSESQNAASDQQQPPQAPDPKTVEKLRALGYVD